MQTYDAWIGGLLGAVSLLAGAYGSVYLLRGRPRFAPAAAHAAMGAGMAAMFVPAADPVPRTVWVAVFVVVAAWFGVACVRGSTLFGAAGHHAVGGVAMLSMLLAYPQVTAGVVDHGHAHHGGAAGAGPSLLTAAIALGFVAWFVADVGRLLLRPGGAAAPAVPPPGPVGVDPATVVGAGTAVRTGRDRHVTVPAAVLSAVMAIMFLGMV